MVSLAEAHQVANVHISSLLGVFLTPELNPVWNDRLVEQRLLYLNGIRHAYQVYEMPCANSSHWHPFLTHPARKSSEVPPCPFLSGAQMAGRRPRASYPVQGHRVLGQKCVRELVRVGRT